MSALVGVLLVHAVPPMPLRPVMRGLSSPPHHHHLQAQSTSPASPLKTFWDEHHMLLIALVGSLTIMGPMLRSLPRQAGLTATVVLIALIQMAFDLPPDLVLLEAVVVLVGLRVLTMKEALDGFRAEGVVTVGVMCAVAKSVQVTGGLNLIAKYMLGSPKGYEAACLRMTLAVLALSAFMNNTVSRPRRSAHAQAFR